MAARRPVGVQRGNGQRKRKSSRFVSKRFPPLFFCCCRFLISPNDNPTIRRSRDIQRYSATVYYYCRDETLLLIVVSNVNCTYVRAFFVFTFMPRQNGAYRTFVILDVFIEIARRWSFKDRKRERVGIRTWPVIRSTERELRTFEKSLA